MTMRRAWLGLMCAGMLAGAVGTAARAEEPTSGKPPALSASGRMRDALEHLGDGREVELVLTNGKSYRGKLAGVGSDTVLLTEIAGKELSDVLIELDDVAAVEVRVRGN